MLKEFIWGPVGKKNCRADLRRHVNFVFPDTPQVFFLAYISAFIPYLLFTTYYCFVHTELPLFGLVYVPMPPARYLSRKSSP